MAGITIRNIPETILNKIRTRSTLEKRSINSELLVIIENGLTSEAAGNKHISKKLSLEARLHIWKNLSGSWIDTRSTDTSISDITSSRTKGRFVEL